MSPSWSHILRCVVHTPYAQVHAHCIPSACLSSATDGIHTYVHTTKKKDKTRRDKTRPAGPRLKQISPLPLHLPGFLFMQIVHPRQDTAAGSPTERPDVTEIDCCWSTCFLPLLSLTRRGQVITELPTHHPWTSPPPASHLTLHRSLTSCQLLGPPTLLASAARAGLVIEDHQACSFYICCIIHYCILDDGSSGTIPAAPSLRRPYLSLSRS